MPSAAQQAEQRLAKASSVTSLVVKPKGKAAKGLKGKQAGTGKGAKGRKTLDDDTPRKKRDRVNWNAAGLGRRRSVDQAPAGRQFADAASLHQV